MLIILEQVGWDFLPWGMANFQVSVLLKFSYRKVISYKNWLWNHQSLLTCWVTLFFFQVGLETIFEFLLLALLARLFLPSVLLSVLIRVGKELALAFSAIYPQCFCYWLRLEASDLTKNTHTWYAITMEKKGRGR